MNGPTMRLRMEGNARRTSNPSPRSRVRGTITVSIGEAGSRSANGSSGMFQLIAPLQSRARAAQVAFRNPFGMRRPVPRRPLGPAGVHLLREESLLCQLQSGFRRELSGLAPAIGDELLVTRQLGRELGQLPDRGADGARDVPLGERIAGPGVEERDLRSSTLVLHPRLHVRQLALGAQLLGEVLAVSSDVFLRKGHRHTSAT